MALKKIKLIFLTLFLIISLTSLTTALWTTNLNDGLAGYWNFNETSGTRYDSLGVNNITTTGTINSDVGIIGNSWSGNGNNNHGSFSSNPFANTEELTLSLWLNCTADTLGNRILGTAPSYSDFDWSFNNCFQTNVGTCLTLNGQTGLTINEPICDSNWHNVLFTIKSGGNITLYIDDVYKLDSSAGTFTNLAYPTLAFGWDGDDIGTELRTTQKVDEFGVWNRTLNSTEISTLYNSGAGITYTNQQAPQLPIIINQTDCSGGSIGFEDNTYSIEENISNCASSITNNVLIEGNNNYYEGGFGTFGFTMDSNTNVTINNLNILGNGGQTITTASISSIYLNNVTLFDSGNSNPSFFIDAVFSDVFFYNVTSYSTKFFQANRFADVSNIIFEKVNIKNLSSGDSILLFQFDEEVNTNVTLIDFVMADNENNGEIKIYNKNLNINSNVHLIFGTNVFIENNNIGVVNDINSAGLFFENTSAELKLKNLNFTNPRVLRNGIVCPNDVCTNLVYVDGTATFDVTGFSNYTLEETPEPPTPTTTTDKGELYNILNSSGAGLGKFMQYIGYALPILLIGLVFVAIIIAIFTAIPKLIKSYAKSK